MLPNEPVPSPVKPEGVNPDIELVKRQLVSLLQQAKKVAEANNINFSEVLAEVESNKSNASATMPRPPGPMAQQGPPPL